MTQSRHLLDLALHDTVSARRWPPELGRPVTDDEWYLVRERGQVEALQWNTLPAEELASVLIEVRRTYPQRAPRQGPSAERLGSE